MITAKLVMWDYDGPTKWGYPLKILVTMNRKMRPVHLKRYVSPEYWNKKEEEPKWNCRDQELIDFVADKKREIKEILKHCNQHKMTFSQVLEVFKDGLKTVPGTDMTFIEFFGMRLKEMEEEGKRTEFLEEVKKKIEVFGDVPLKEVDYEYISRFHRWAITEGMQPNGIYTYLSKMRTIYYTAQKRRSLGLDWSLKPFHGNMPKLRKTAKKAIYKTDIEKLETSNIHPHVNLWLLMFYMGGMSFVDIAKLKWSQYSSGRIKYSRSKLDDPENLIDLKVFPKAQEIIELLGTSDDERMFSFIPDPDIDYKRYRSFQRNLNQRHLRRVSEQLNLERVIVTKSARHSFRTIGRHLKIDGDILNELMGHEGEGVEYIYQDRFPQKQRDEAHGKIIESASPSS